MLSREHKIRYSKIWYVVGALLAANISAIAAISASGAADHATLHFFDVGQGDGIYLRTASGNDIVIDTGPGDLILSKLGRAMPFFDHTIEFLILTHPHADHVSGAIGVLKRYEVKQMLLPDVDYDSITYREVLSQIERQKIDVAHPRAGERIYLDEATVLDIFSPIVRGFEEKDLNDVSIVAKLSYGRMNALLTGDAGKDVERMLLALNLPLESEILKVGHHGSKHSTSAEFLKKASSTYAVVSVGKNSYGHPHEQVLGLLLGETQLLRTDEEGDIVFDIYKDRLELRD